MPETETFEIQKLKKLKKGNKIKIKGQEYEVEDFKDIRTYDNSKKMALREIILNKIGGVGDLKGKYAIMYNEKTGEIKMYKGIHERSFERWKHGSIFKFKSEKTFFMRR